MHVSALEEYGVRCALQLAREHQKGPIPASRIAEKESLSIEYVSKIMHLFRKAGLVSAERGNRGGFYLAKAPSEISLQSVFLALKAGNTVNHHNFCGQFKGQGEECVHSGECALRPVWTVVWSYFDEVLQTIALGDLLTKEVDAEKVVQALAAEKAKRITSLFNKGHTIGAKTPVEA